MYAEGAFLTSDNLARLVAYDTNASNADLGVSIANWVSGAIFTEL